MYNKSLTAQTLFYISSLTILILVTRQLLLGEIATHFTSELRNCLLNPKLNLKSVVLKHGINQN